MSRQCAPVTRRNLPNLHYYEEVIRAGLFIYEAVTESDHGAHYVLSVLLPS